MKRKETNIVKLELSKNEALIFYAWLQRFNESEQVFEDQAEERVLWNIESLMESILSDPFLENFDALLKKAREEVRDPTE